jgi:hypothetical protein
LNTTFAELNELAEVFWHKSEGLGHRKYLMHAADATAPCAGQHIGLQGRENDEEHAEGALFENHEEPIRVVE